MSAAAPLCMRGCPAAGLSQARPASCRVRRRGGRPRPPRHRLQPNTAAPELRRGSCMSAQSDGCRLPECREAQQRGDLGGKFASAGRAGAAAPKHGRETTNGYVSCRDDGLARSGGEML